MNTKEFKQTKLKISILLLLIVSLFYSCGQNLKQKNIILSKDYKHSVENWLKNFDTTINIIVLYGKPADSIEYYLNNADGIIITGGEDVNPALYGKDSLLSLCGQINTYRDSLEIQMINFAIENKVPLLGICRGLQIMNVSQGGSLIVDIPTFCHDSIHRKNGHTWHLVNINDEKFRQIAQVAEDTVYSNHHQAIDKIANMFIATAFATDSIIEAIRRKDTTITAIAVQWHPEAMDYTAPLSKNIAKYFLNKIYRKHQLP